MYGNPENSSKAVIVQVIDEGEYSRSLIYLLPDGRKRKVTIDQSHDGETMRARIGDALVKHLTKG